MRALTFLLATLLITLPVGLPAHEGHDHKVMGTVSMIHENHLEVTDAKGKTIAMTMNAKSKIRRANKAFKAADIKVGDRVVVTYREVKDKAGQATRTVMQIQLA